MLKDEEYRDEQQRMTPEELSDQLYPTPKSYNQLAIERKRLDDRRVARRPRYPLFGTNAIVAFALVLILKSELLLLAFVNTLGAMAGTFLLYLFGASVAGLCLWQFMRIRHYFYAYGMAGSWYVWLLIVGGFAAGAIYTELLQNHKLFQVVAVCIGYYLVTLVVGLGSVALHNNKN